MSGRKGEAVKKYVQLKIFYIVQQVPMTVSLEVDTALICFGKGESVKEIPRAVLTRL